MQKSNATTLQLPKQPTNQKKKKTVVQIQKVIEKNGLVYRVPECAESYFHALCDPFNVPQGVCIPADLFPIPSQKVKSFIRSTLKLGQSGIGFIAINPTIANDVVCTSYTTSTSVGNSATIFSSFTATGGSMMSQLPYGLAQIRNGSNKMGVCGRIVAAGVRVKYIGKAMDSNGVCVGLEDPDHGDVLVSNWDTLNSNFYSNVVRVSINDYWDKAICYSGPSDPSQIAFSSEMYPLNGNTSLIIAISGIASDLYEFEFVQHTEYIGRAVVSRTFSHAEPLAYGKILETVKAATIDRPLEPPMTKSLWQNFKEHISESLPQLVSGGYNVVKSVLEMNPAALIEGYQGVNKGFQILYGDYGKTQVEAVKGLPAPSHHHSFSSNQYDRIPVVRPSKVEVVDELLGFMLPGMAKHDEVEKEKEDKGKAPVLDSPLHRRVAR